MLTEPYGGTSGPKPGQIAMQCVDDQAGRDLNNKACKNTFEFLGAKPPVDCKDVILTQPPSCHLMKVFACCPTSTNAKRHVQEGPEGLSVSRGPSSITEDQCCPNFPDTHLQPGIDAVLVSQVSRGRSGRATSRSILGPRKRDFRNVPAMS